MPDHERTDDRCAEKSEDSDSLQIGFYLHTSPRGSALPLHPFSSPFSINRRQLRSCDPKHPERGWADLTEDTFFFLILGVLVPHLISAGGDIIRTWKAKRFRTLDGKSGSYVESASVSLE